MTTLETIIKKDVLDLIKITKEENKTKINNESLPMVYESYDLTMLTQYLKTIKEEFYDVDKFACLLDDIRYFEEASPVIERLHHNIETSMHNKAALQLAEKSQIFQNMMTDYYIINDVECDLITTFLELIQKHIDASKDKSLNYLSVLGRIRDNVDFKYNSNVETYAIVLPHLDDEEIQDKINLYLENMIIRCMYEIAKYNNKNLTNEETYAKVNALAIFLQAALTKVKNKSYVHEYQLLSNRIPLDTTAKGIVNTAFVQEREMQKKLVKDDENGL